MKLFYQLSIMLFLGAGNAVAKSKTPKVTTFSETVAEYKAKMNKSTDSGSIIKKIELKGYAEPIKISIPVDKKCNYILSGWSSNNTKDRDYIVIKDAALVDAKGKRRQVSTMQAVAKTGGYVRFRISEKNENIRYRGETSPNSIQMFMPAQVTVPTFNSEKLEMKVMLDSKPGSTATFYIIKEDASTPETDKMNETFRNDISVYSTYAGSSYKALLSTPGTILEENTTLSMIKRLEKPALYLNKFNETIKIGDYQTKVKELINIFKEAERIYQVQERLSWLKLSSVEAAFNQLKKVKGYDVKTNQARLNELKTIVNKGFASLYAMNEEGYENAQKALLLQKQILLDNPEFNFDSILIARYDVGTVSRNVDASKMGTQRNNWSNQTSAPREGFNGEIGVFTNLRGDMKYNRIFKPDWSTSMPDIRLHWNADRFMFTMNQKGDHHWQVYELDIDGKNLRQITDGAKEHLDFFDACYLSNGKIAVMANVGGQGVPCVNGNDQVGNLCLFDPKTKNLRRMTFDQDANWGPVMMHNGKLMYTRWEYTDLTHYFSRFVMSMNPDGTEQKALFGSGMLFPNSIFDIQPLPYHHSRFVGVISGHHGVVRSGRLFLFDPMVSRNDTSGMVHEFPYKGRRPEPIVKDGLVDNVWPQFIKPYPIDNDNFIVTGKMDAQGLWGLYLVDTHDNLVLLAEYECEGLIHATPIRKMPVPPVIPDKVKLDDKEATVFIQDIYEGEGLPNVPRGTVKQLRIMTYEYAYLKTPSNHTAQGIQSGWDMKTCLGVVPVEEDGSAIFKIPANTPISLQPLDSEGRAIQWMRSWLTGMPGEVVSCVGCHEDQNKIVIPKRVMASARNPHKMKVPEGGLRPFTFKLEIQPILDRNCVSCHNAEHRLNFTGNRHDEFSGNEKSYLALHPYTHRQGSEAAMKVLVSYEYHANVSPLVQLLENGHYGVKLTDKEMKAIYNWIDFNVPGKGYFDICNDIFPDQYNRRIAMGKKYANGVHNDWRKQMKDYAEYLEKQNNKAVKHEYKEPKFKKVKVKEFKSEGKPERMTLNIAPGVDINFVKVPAGTFAMGENRANSNAAPARKTKIQKSFWMSETELTNEQIRAIFPDHNSRQYDQMWKDHVHEGYPANGDKQVAIRISWNKANEYCQKLSEKTGKNIMLPTEAQWEWAAKGGTNADYWFGEKYDSFGTFENLSDKQMLQMAVSGVDPKPMKENDPWYPYFTFHPKAENVDDGNMLTALPGSYKANAFGLYDMVGNVSEWTRSDYFPASEKVGKHSVSDRKVVKGGAWDTHPKDARAARRLAFYPWQAPYNVGMRLVIEE